MPRPIKFCRMNKSILESENKIIQKDDIILEIPDGIDKENPNGRFKFKVGDGTTRWNDLPYSDTIPCPILIRFKDDNFVKEGDDDN